MALQAKSHSLSLAIATLMRRQGGKVRLHPLRHSHASQMLAEGVRPKVVQERLGHAQHRNHHGHLQPRDAEYAGQAGGQDDEALKAAQKKNRWPTKWQQNGSKPPRQAKKYKPNQDICGSAPRRINGVRPPRRKYLHGPAQRNGA
jgi:Phage integrase family